MVKKRVETMAKNKHDVPVSTARFRLNATLQDLVEKKDDGLSDEEESGSQSEAAMRGPSSPFSSPSKRSSYSRSTGRKRKRKDDLDGFETDHYHHTYVMKLFDRSVDLAQFEESTPLYPICRAWMRNKPRSKEVPHPRSPSPDLTSLSDEETGNVYQLPQPVCVKLENSEDRDVRIPSPVEQTDPSLDIDADPDTAPPPEQLLLNHMARWKLTREKWRVASLRNEDRFAPSMNLLRDMFEQQMKENC